MAKYILMVCTGLLWYLSFVLSIQARDCPPPSQIYTCKPLCFNDGDCAFNGGKCCPNMCNQKSCVAPHLLTNYGSKTNKYGSGSVYCGNVKCSPFEKCVTDRYTGRKKCVRA